MRSDRRRANQLRKVTVKRGYLKNALGSCLIQMGETRVLCAASVEEKVPIFCKGSGRGWLTAEYSMLPASCPSRVTRESSKGKLSGRTQEIQRLIGRSLRAVTDLTMLGERTIWIDADVIQGDGGTRTAAITGGFIALADAIHGLMRRGDLVESPIQDYVAAISVGIIGGKCLLDLCYEEDSQAEVDMNVVMTGSGEFVEVQGTAEGKPFTSTHLKQLTATAKKGIDELVQMQKKYARI